MKLAAIYNVWDGVELLHGSMNCLRDHVDQFIIVYQDISNYGEQYDPLPDLQLLDFSPFDLHIIKYMPQTIGIGFKNEINKRNAGLNAAMELGCTHFMHIDCDEYYEDFGKAKQQYISSGKSGSVCRLYTYFKHPTWRLEKPDNYFVPLIHELKPHTVAGAGNYPFYVDPTRKINELNVAEIPSFMHHFSYVRKDIDRKVRNSSARANIEKSQLLKDYHSKELEAFPEGFYIKDFYQKLVIVPNNFNIQL